MKTGRTIRLIHEDIHNAWDMCADHPLQTWAWGEFRKRMGVDIVRIGEFEGSTLIGVWQISFHDIPLTSLTVGYFPKGPEITPDMVRFLSTIGKSKHAVYIQIEPNTYTSYSNPKIPSLHPSHHPLFTKYTFVLDLTKSEDALLSAMHPKTRYNIKVAQKHNVKIIKDNTPQGFGDYIRLSEETTKRQKFFAHNRTYQQTMWDVLHASGMATLWKAVLNNETLATWIVFVHKDTVYYPYGASARTHRETMAPNLMLWEIALWAKKKGLKRFDLWGALGPDPDPKDPWFGFHRFKAGYNPELIKYSGSFDLILSPLLYPLYCLADSVRWTLLRVFH